MKGRLTMRYILIVILMMLMYGCSNDSEEGVYTLEEDMGKIGDIIGDHDVVLISEPTHASADLNKVSIDLINNLNKEKEYNIVGLETSTTELEYYLDYSTNASLDTIRNESVMEKYRTEKFTQLYENHYNDALDFTLKGINWLPVTYSSPTFNTLLLEDIYSDIEIYDLNHATAFKNIEIDLRRFTTDVIYGESESINYDLTEKYLNVYRMIANSDYYSSLEKGTQYVIESRISLLNGPLSSDYLEGYTIHDSYQEYYSRRGKGMFETVESLVEEGNKVIVWVHNWHALRAPQSVDVLSEEWKNVLTTDHYSLGYHLAQSDLDTFSIGMVFNEAKNFTSFYLNNENLEKITDESFLEGKLSTYNKEQIFIELNQNPDMDETYVAYDEGFIKYELVPTEQFDALIYLDSIME